ncbi:MAG: hypothetical protein HY854_05935 [Burkholderiales bacterium]|nr:hypothetical protein [Burkholderiales bacterium]
MNTYDPSIESEIRNHVWAYFSLHAQQRISVFQYFVTIETALFGGAFFAIQNISANGMKPLALVGVFIAILAFVFWKIDQRTKGMIKNAEEALVQIEEFLLKESTLVRDLPFLMDPQRKSGLNWKPLIYGHLSYSKSFGIIFLSCGTLGLALAAWLGIVLKP